MSARNRTATGPFVAMRSHYNRFRYFNSIVGRYVNADPVGQQDDINVYSYARNAPISRTDSLGLGAPGAGFQGAGLSVSVPNGPRAPIPPSKLPGQLACVSKKTGKFLGAPTPLVAGPLVGMLKGGAIAGGGSLMTVGGLGVTVAGGVMTAGGTVSAGTGALAGIPTMAAGVTITGSGAAAATIGALKVQEEFIKAAEIFAGDCGCDPSSQCCEK